MPIPKQNDSALSSVIDIRTAGVNTEDAVVADTLLFRVLLFLGPRARFQNLNDPDNRRRSRKFHRSFFVVYVPSGRATLSREWAAASATEGSSALRASRNFGMLVLGLHISRSG